LKDKKEKIQYYDWYSLYEVTNPKGGIENFFVFDDINSFAEDFHFNTIINYPIRLGMMAIIFCKKGYLKLRIGLVDALINPNMVLTIFPEQIFQPTEVSPDFEAGYILLSKEFFDVQNDFKMVFDLQTILSKRYYIQLPEKDMEEALTVFHIIKRKIEEQHTSLFLKEVIQTYIRALFYIACNIIFETKEKVIKTRKEEIFETFVSLLEQNFRKEQNIGWYAAKFCLTPKYLSKLVYEASGKHAGDWIKEYIILNAKALLNSSSLTVQQISDELGFSNQSHFGSYFKRYTGMSPREYKQGKG